MKFEVDDANRSKLQVALDRANSGACVHVASAADVIALAARAEASLADRGIPPRERSGGEAVVDRLAQEQNVQFEPIALRGTDGRVTRGIWALRDGKPLIAMTATPMDEVLYVRIGGGFQPAIVLCDDNECDA